MARVRKYFVFTGRVQGVGFRYSANYLAQSLGLTGWVRNEWDGTVSMEIQGNQEDIDRLLERLRSGRFIRIDYISEMDMPLKKENGFHVR